MNTNFSPPPSRLGGAIVVVLILYVWSMSARGRTLTKRLYLPAPVELRDSALTSGPDCDGGYSTRVIEVRGAMDGIGERPGLATAYWGVDLIGTDDDTVRITLRHGNTAFGDLLDKRQSLLTVRKGREILAEKDVSAFESSSGTYNTLRIAVDRPANTISVSGGGRGVEDIFILPLEGRMPADRFEIWSVGHLALSSVSIEDNLSPEEAFLTGWSQQRLAEYLSKSTDPNEGYWQFLDRENDPRYARPGGRYTLATVKATDSDAYDIVYIDGADIRRNQWKPMMLKGRLIPTIFLDHYDLEWTDSTFETIERDIHASITDKSILTLSFPLLKTTLRFSKMALR